MIAILCWKSPILNRPSKLIFLVSENFRCQNFKRFPKSGVTWRLAKSNKKLIIFGDIEELRKKSKIGYLEMNLKLKSVWGNLKHLKKNRKKNFLYENISLTELCVMLFVIFRSDHYFRLDLLKYIWFKIIWSRISR